MVTALASASRDELERRIEDRWYGATTEPARHEGETVPSVTNSKRYRRVVDGIEEITAHVLEGMFPGEVDALLEFNDQIAGLIHERVCEFALRIETERAARRSTTAA